MPGPISTWDANYDVDDGTSCRMPSQSPARTEPRSASLWARGEALYQAYERALVLAPAAVYQKTGYALGELLKGLVPGLLQALIILAAGVVLGAVAGGVIGFFFGGAGAAPGAVLGAELGLEIGTAALTWLGLAFLAAAIVQGFGELWSELSAGVKRAWAAPDCPDRDYPHEIEKAAHEFANAAGILLLLVLQAIVAWVFKKAAVGSTKAVIATGNSIRTAGSEAAAAEAVGAVVAQLRASRLGAGFADWVEKNWPRLRDDPRLRFKARTPAGGGPGTVEQPAGTPRERVPSAQDRQPPPSRYSTTRMNPKYVGEDVPGNPIWGTPVKYLSESERAAYKLNIRDGKIYDSSGRLFDTSDASTAHSGGGRAIFVMDENGAFYASKVQQVGEFHHSSLAAGGPVAAAGEMQVDNGVLSVLSDKSGHYMPGRTFTQQALDSLERNGVDTSPVQKDFIGR